MKKIISWVKGVWKDPVWSKVISVGILALIATIWAWYEKKPPSELYQMLLSFLNFSTPLYLILSLIGLVILVRLLVRYFRKNADPLYSEMVGDYTFNELCKILLREKIEMQTVLMEWNRVQPMDATLLTQFIEFAPIMSQGVTFEFPHGDSGYLYALFCPKMMTYGLVDKLSTKHHSGIDMEVYQLSDLGRKFIALWNRHTLKVDSH
jgi:uncharacterized membrane protein